MYSREDLERFYVECQSKWNSRGMTIRAYYNRNNVSYNESRFNKYKEVHVGSGEQVGEDRDLIL